MSNLAIIGKEVIDNGKMHFESFGIVDYDTMELFFFYSINGEDDLIVIKLENPILGESTFKTIVKRYKVLTDLTSIVS